MAKKKKTKKTKKTKKNISKNDKIKSEIIGIIFIAVSIMLFLSQKYESGVVGNYVKHILINLTGNAFDTLPYIMIALGGFYILGLVNKDRKNKSIILIFIFLSYLGLITLLPLNLVESFNDFREIIETTGENTNPIYTYGGGILGGLLSFVLTKLFGYMGTIVILFTVILISIISITKKSILNMIKKFFVFVYKVILSMFNGIKKATKSSKKSNNLNQRKKNKKEKPETLGKKQKENYQIKGYDEPKDKDLSKKNDVLNLSIDKNSKKIEKKAIKKQETKDDVSEPMIKMESKKNDKYKLPSTSLLTEINNENKGDEKREIMEGAEILIETLKNFGIDCKLIQINRGPRITRYELQPAPGVKVSKITNLSKDIALSLAKSDLRIEAPIPGKAAIGIEVPNKNMSNVTLKEILESDEYINNYYDIPFAIGKDIAGQNIISDISGMPHLLIAGATGSGKSVCVNSLILSVLFKLTPDELKMILIDPKVVELNIYNGIPHLLVPVVTDVNKAAQALNWAVQEMSNRYDLFAKKNVRDIDSYNNKEKDDKLPKILIVIDELADLMAASPKEVEDSITRLAQLARAAGIHLVIATQRPSVDVITGTIKANIPTRIAFSVSSYVDSRTILDTSGAEKLLGKGDMLYSPVGYSKFIRIQGSFVSDDDVKKVIDFLKETNSVRKEKEEDSLVEIDLEKEPISEKYDDYIKEAVEVILSEGQASVSLMQRKLSVGYARAARIIDQLEDLGIVEGHVGSKARNIIMNEEEIKNLEIYNK
ncbi:MAG TPA: cell division protein FtsK [Clostridiales bacterium]|nr:cell division protein FtsK [Clostridiales bacterium]